MWYVAIGLSLAIAIGYLVKYSSVLRSILGLPDEADDTISSATQLVTPGNSVAAGPETHTANAATQTSIEFTDAPAAVLSPPFNLSTDALKPSSSSPSSSSPSPSSSSTSTSLSSSSATAADRGPPQEPSSDSSSIRTAAAAAEKKAAIATEAARMLEKQVDTMAAEVERCKQVIVKMEAENSQLRDRLAEQAKVQLTKGPSNFENLSLGENRPSKLIKRYADLYTDDRIDAWDDLDLLPDDIDDDSKQKLLLSIVVLCFRQAQTSLEGRQRAVRTILLSSSSDGPTIGTFDGQEDGVQLDDSLVKDIDDCVESSLRRTVNRHNIFDDFKEVTSQLWSKLVDYPSLRDCPSLLRYIEECLKIAWALTIQNPTYVIDHDVADVFSDDRHTRFHASDPDSNRIESFLWPALIEKPSGYCASKAVVVTRDP